MFPPTCIVLIDVPPKFSCNPYSLALEKSFPFKVRVVDELP